MCLRQEAATEITVIGGSTDHNDGATPCKSANGAAADPERVSVPRELVRSSVFASIVSLVVEDDHSTRELVDWLLRDAGSETVHEKVLPHAVPAPLRRAAPALHSCGNHTVLDWMTEGLASVDYLWLVSAPLRNRDESLAVPLLLTWSSISAPVQSR
jgi:hypothetical protein